MQLNLIMKKYVRPLIKVFDVEIEMSLAASSAVVLTAGDENDMLQDS